MDLSVPSRLEVIVLDQIFFADVLMSCFATFLAIIHLPSLFQYILWNPFQLYSSLLPVRFLPFILSEFLFVSWFVFLVTSSFWVAVHVFVWFSIILLGPIIVFHPVPHFSE